MTTRIKEKFFIRLIFLVLLLLLGIVLTMKAQAPSYGDGDEAVTYRLFPTQNMWTFIKLNTRNGQMWQVQYDVPGDNRFVTDLSLVSRVATENESNGRFILYPTQNMYTFILLDQVDGRTWQAQWSMKAETRVIVPIE